MTIDYRLTLSGCSNILIVQDISKCDHLRKMRLYRMSAYFYSNFAHLTKYSLLWIF